MTTARHLYERSTLIAADYAFGSDVWPMKVEAYDPPGQVTLALESCRYPRYDGKRSPNGREFYLDQALIDPYDLAKDNGSNRTQLVSNDLDNTFAAFLPGERKTTAFVTELSGEGLPKLGNKTGDYSQVMQWKSIRADGSGSDPYLHIGEADDGLVLVYNSRQYWESRGKPSLGYKETWPIPGDFKGRQIKLVLEARFSGVSLDGYFRLRGELTGNPAKGLHELVDWQYQPILSFNSPGATVSWGPYQETWLPSIARRYWDVEVLV
jgi:hypothetical protein